MKNKTDRVYLWLFVAILFIAIGFYYFKETRKIEIPDNQEEIQIREADVIIPIDNATQGKG